MEIENQYAGFLKTNSILKDNAGFDFEIFKLEDDSTLKNNTHPDIRLANPRNSVLGKRMETFFELAINASSRYELIASNVQIIENKKTIGELDFLVHDKQRNIPLHIELVYKLYIYHAGFQNIFDRWIGPNKRDSFSKKLEKLQAKQFPLLYTSETKAHIERYKLDLNKIEQRLCFKAKLFLPEIKSVEFPEYINTDCIAGNWYTYDEFKNKNWQENLFFSPPKKFWSSEPELNTEWTNYNNITAQLEALFQKEKSPLIWMKSGNIFKSFFVVWW